MTNLYPPTHHLDLHSFPTRRSSDLGGSGASRSPRSWGTSTCSCPTSKGGPSAHWTTGANGPTGSTRPAPRSEEHTPELQSRLHLVCCLLLGKKILILPMDSS